MQSKYLSAAYFGSLRMPHLSIAGLRASPEVEKLRFFPQAFFKSIRFEFTVQTLGYL